MQTRIQAVLCIAMVSLSIQSTVDAATIQASFTVLDALPGTNENFCGADALSADGLVIGGYARTNRSTDGREAALWSAGPTPTGLGGFPTTNFWGHVRALSDDGQVAVGSTNLRNAEQPFRVSQGGMQALPLPPGYYGGEAFGVSANGEVAVGLANFIGTRFGNPVLLSEAVVWQNGHVQRLGFLGAGVKSQANDVSANGRVVVGDSFTEANDGSRLAVMWIAGDGPFVIGDVPGGLERSSAVAVSADGNTACGWGTTTTHPYRQQFFRWTRVGGLAPLGKLPGHFHSQPNDMSPDGQQIVGWSAAVGAVNRTPVIWDAVNGMRDIVSVLEAAGLDLTYLRDQSGDLFMEATGVSADGLTIVGYGHIDNTRRAWVATLQ
ncbi:MAG: putative membrane protein [Planctomycetota bacterium]|jgi:uncharacterized membrane protein